MTDYIYNHYEQKNLNPNGRADWCKTKDFTVNRNRTERNLELATNNDTMRFFRNLGSKQEIKRSYNKEGKETIKIYSYCPTDKTIRTVHEFIEK